MPIRIQTKPDVKYRGLQLEKKDIKAFRVNNLIRGAYDEKIGGFEREICKAERQYREQDGNRANHDGYTLPACLFRAIEAGTDADGGFLVDEDNAPRAFADYLYAESVILPRATVLENLQGPVNVGVATGAVRVAWGGEAATVANSDPAFGRRPLSPKELSVATPVSKFLIQQSDPSAENVVRMSMMDAFAQEFDNKILYGTGTSSQMSGLNQLDRIKNETTHPGRIDYVDNRLNRSTFTAALNVVGKSNAKQSDMIYLLGWDLYTAARSSNNIFRDELLIGIPAMGTSIVTDTDGWLGNFKYLVCGIWGGMDISVDDTSLAAQGQVRVVGHYRVDAAPLHENAFAQIKRGS